ncbi:MAG: hypothetical protein M3P49_12740 [Actinomycetota bacterium]|nr:hypothetical protein [Actinomycetota bacterium]
MNWARAYYENLAMKEYGILVRRYGKLQPYFVDHLIELLSTHSDTYGEVIRERKKGC